MKIRKLHADQVAPSMLILSNEQIDFERYRDKVSAYFFRLGYDVIGVFVNGKAAIDLLDSIRPAVVAIQMDSKGEICHPKAAQVIAENFLIPLVFINPVLKITNKTLDIPPEKTPLFIQQGAIFIKINVEEILFIKAERNFCHLYTFEQTYRLTVPLKTVEAQLPNHPFVRSHRSFLINLDSINTLDVQGNHLTIQDHKIPISRRFKSNLFRFIRRL